MGVPGQNLLGLTLAFDNNMIGNELAATRFLARLHREGCIAVVVSDDVDNELLKAPESKYEALTEEAAMYRRNFGVAVLGYSRLGSAVFAGDEDVDLMNEVRAILKPGLNREDWKTASENDIRDAKHVHTAIRYGATGFVTLDQGILAKADHLAALVKVWTPYQAARVASKRLRNYHTLKRLRESQDARPRPSDAEID